MTVLERRSESRQVFGHVGMSRQARKTGKVMEFAVASRTMPKREKKRPAVRLPTEIRRLADATYAEDARLYREQPSLRAFTRTLTVLGDACSEGMNTLMIVAEETSPMAKALKAAFTAAKLKADCVLHPPGQKLPKNHRRILILRLTPLMNS